METIKEIKQAINYTVTELGHLRDYSSSRIAVALANAKHFGGPGIDPDVAVIAAWKVHHTSPPQNWPAYISKVYSKMSEYSYAVSRGNRPDNIPVIADRIIDIIMDHYKNCKVGNLPMYGYKLL